MPCPVIIPKICSTFLEDLAIRDIVLATAILFVSAAGLSITIAVLALLCTIVSAANAVATVLLRFEYFAAPFDPMLVAFRPEYSAAPSDSMLAALLQQWDLITSLVASRKADNTAAMSAIFDCLDRLERSQTDHSDREFPDL